MLTATSSAETFHSPEFTELRSLFLSLEQPYGTDEIARFNRLYKRIYSRLSLSERLRAEEFVDELIAGIEREELACRIFGVV
jgi:hypothetical protein